MFNGDGNLTEAYPASGSAATDAAFHYVWQMPQGATFPRLQRITDPLGRNVTVTLDAYNRIDLITAWGGRTWDLDYSGGNLTSVTDPDGDTRAFDYGGSGRLTSIRDGKATASAEDGWDITYGNDLTGFWRVQAVVPPGLSGPNTNVQANEELGDYWDFDYVGPFKGSVATQAKVTDPLGSSTFSAEDYETVVDFTWAGLPLRITRPADQHGYRGKEIYVWDENSSLICERSPIAVAKDGEGPLDETCRNEALNTVYRYQTRAPYLMTKIEHAQSSIASGTPRQIETFDYDTGSSFNGLWAEIYPNERTEGEPQAERPWTDLEPSFGTGAPPPLGAGNDWSVRLTGYLDVTDFTEATDVRFKVESNDGISVTIGDKTIVDCFGEVMTPSTPNCDLGEDTVTKTLAPGMRPITIEFSELTDQANFSIRWDAGDPQAALTTIGAWRLSPNIGILTEHTVTLDTGLTRVTTWDYSSDEAKERRLPISETTSQVQSGGPAARTSSFVYNDYGQTTDVTTPAGTTTFLWTNGPAPSGWQHPPNADVTCMRKLTDPTGAVTNYECDSAGRVVRQEVKVPDVAGTNQTTATDRVVETTYDESGRPLTVDDMASISGTPDTTYVYDRAGRLKREDHLITGSTVATTTTTYDLRGNVATVTTPDPDTTAGRQAAVVTYTYDTADNPIEQTDPRNASWVTETTYDALNRVIQTEVPDGNGDGLITTVDHDLKHGGTFYNQRITTAPNGVSTVEDLDLLGRTTRTRAENRLVNPQVNGAWTDADLDVAGNVQSTTVHYETPGGDVRTEHDYSVFGELLETRAFANAAADKVATTTWTYDTRGFMTTWNGPRPNDAVDYTLDAVGRITKVEQPGLDVPGSTDSLSTGVIYSAVGEMLRVRTPMRYESGVFVYLVRKWTYDAAGNMTSFADDAGTTTHDYNAAGWLTRTAVDGPSPGDDVIRRFGYDDLGRLTARWVGDVNLPANGTEQTYLGYDRASMQVCAANAAGTVQSRYDATGRLDGVWSGGSSDCDLSDQQALDPPSGATFVTDHVYNDGAGGVLEKIKDLQLGVGTAGQTSLTYDALGRPATLNDPLTAGITEYSWDSAGRLSTSEYHAGTDPNANDVTVTWAHGYEGYSGRTKSLTATNAAATELLYSALAYDLAGNVDDRTQRVGGVLDTWDYTYDPANRLIGADGPGTAQDATYEYDGASNRLKTIVDGVSATTVYSGAGTPLSTTYGSGAIVTYDADGEGNLTLINNPDSGGQARPDVGFGYDGWGRVATTTYDGDLTTFTIDPLDRLVARTPSGGAAATMSYRGLGEDLVSAGTTTYANGLDGPIASSTGTPNLLLSNLHTDVVAAVSTTGTVQATRTYTPYGTQRTTTGSAPGNVSLGFQSEPSHRFTDGTDVVDVVDMGIRVYVPTLGRFATRDVLFGSLANPATLNQFGYAGGNPLTYVDPTGMLWDTPTQGSSGCGTSGRCRQIVKENSRWFRETYDPGCGCYEPSPPPPPPPAPSGVVAPVAQVPSADAVSDVACLDTCSSGWRSWVGHALDTLTDCMTPFSTSCASSAQGLGVRTIEDTVGGGECYWNATTNHDVCTGVTRKWATVRGPAFTVGNTVTVDDGEEYRVEVATHEGGHIRQGERMGIAYLPAYGVSTAASYIVSGTNNCNVMEVAAGPGGGYPPCHPWWSR